MSAIEGERCAVVDVLNARSGSDEVDNLVINDRLTILSMVRVKASGKNKREELVESSSPVRGKEN